MRKVQAWIQASRPLAQVNIAVPLLLGQCLGFVAAGTWSWTLFALIHLTGLIDQLFIVFTNDVADEAGDRHHTTPTAFSGGSRVLIEGKLAPNQLKRAATGAGWLLVVVAGSVALGFDRPFLVPAWFAAIALAWAYSWQPLALSYRGFGEIAQGIGVGVMLPLIGFYTQAGSFEAFPWTALIPLFIVGAAGNINTALPDHDADKKCNKQTWPVRFGYRRAQKHSLQFFALGTFATPWVLPHASSLVWALVEATPAIVLALNALILSRSKSGGPASCGRFVFLNGLAQNLLLAGWIIAVLLPP